MNRHRAGIALAAVALAASACVAVSGCTDEVEKVRAAVEPAAWDLTTPDSAVRSYIDWVSFSYRMANSEIPTATMTADEGVRVDSYIQLNRIDGKGIEQQLDSLEVTSVSEEASSAVVCAQETWKYRYFSLATLEYLSEPLSASYETTYTLVLDTNGWLVDHVEATARGDVQ